MNNFSFTVRFGDRTIRIRISGRHTAIIVPSLAAIAAAFLAL